MGFPAYNNRERNNTTMKRKTKRAIIWACIDFSIVAFAFLWAASPLIWTPNPLTAMGFMLSFPIAAMLEGFAAEAYMTKAEYKKYCENDI